MDDRGPRISLQRKPAQLDKKRFHLEWHLPLEPGLPTHAALFDLQGASAELMAESEGGDEAETLLKLWTTLTERKASAEATAFLAELSIHRGGIRSKIPSDTTWNTPHILGRSVFSQELFFAQDLTGGTAKCRP